MAKEEFVFEKEEKVLCFHGPLLYEAKILDREYKALVEGEETGPHYFVHYKGWKQTWDEWVPETRALKYAQLFFYMVYGNIRFSDENLKRQKDLQDTRSKKVGNAKETVGLFILMLG